MGKELKKDLEEAFKWILKAAEKGHNDAQFSVGLMYDYGQGVERDFKKAFKWLLKAAQKGNDYAQFMVGSKYQYGIGVKRDYNKAYYWYLKLAKQGDSYAKYRLGIMHYNGYGVKKDYILAYAWANSALEKLDLKDIRELINKLEKKMTPEQIVKAQSIDPLKILNQHSVENSKSTATAFFVNKNNLVTNYHAIKNCNQIEVFNKYYNSKVTIKYKDPINDLAILESANQNSNFIYIRDGSYIKVGEDIIALGYPLSNILGDNIKLTLGIVSSLSGISNDITNIQHTAPIQPGNSGAPLLDHSGNLVGVIVARLQKEQNVNFAIKSTIVEMFLNTNSIKYYKRESNKI